MVSLTPIALKERDVPAEFALTSATQESGAGDYGAKYPVCLDSGRVTVIIENGTSGGGAADIDVVLEAGDTQFALEETIEVPSGKAVALNVDNGKHKNILDANKGYVILTSSSPFKAAVIENAV